MKPHLQASPSVSPDIYILLSIKTRIETATVEAATCRLIKFISYYPLKQGLKPVALKKAIMQHLIIYILLSIKTRIETMYRLQKEAGWSEFISYYPLKQGLKQEAQGSG